MAYNEKLADRTRELISITHTNVEEKRMFGGLCFMVNDKMYVGVEKERLMVRLDPALFEEVIELEGCKPMDFTGKVMKGFVFVAVDSLNTKKKLSYWIDLALEFNKKAKATKKKQRKNNSLLPPVSVKMIHEPNALICFSIVYDRCIQMESFFRSLPD